MTIKDWSVVGAALGFIGSLVLFYPGWRASCNFQQIERIRALVSKNETDPDSQAKSANPGSEILDILEEHDSAWRRSDHWLLITGITLIILSFAVDLFMVKLAE